MTTPPTYIIEHVRDFLKVPAHRRDACLAEFREFLEIASEFTTMADAMRDIVSPSSPNAVVGAFTWIDDGKAERTIRLNIQEEKDLPTGPPCAQ